MRRLFAVLACAVVLVMGVLVGAPADAASRGCVSSVEYAKVRTGWAMPKVHHTFGTSGRQLFRNGATVGNAAREYRACPGLASSMGRRVQVQYNNYATRGGPMRVVFKQVY